MADTAAAEFEAHRARLFGIAYRMLGSASEAEDIVQEAYLRWERAEVLEISEANSRQLYRRAKQAVHVSAPVATATDATTTNATTADATTASATTAAAGDAPGDPGDQGRERWVGLVETFVTAAREGDLARLERLLADDVVSYADGGGQISAALRPILGPAKVARYLAGGPARYAAGVDLVPYEVNGGPALLACTEGRLLGVVSLEVADGRIAALRISASPEKLAYAARQFTAYRPVSW
ncbi:sigma factor [Streptomyces sp. 3N207]|uniref:sigma factor n=1 Tax=Streptomyces sp. 3N207 TaxID=3457417 RepID=UPI003FD5E44B